MSVLTLMMNDTLPNLAKPNIVFDFRRKIFIKENALTDVVCDELVKFGNDNVQKGINKYPGLFDISFHTCLLPIDHTIHVELYPLWKEAISYLGIDVNFVEPYELKRYTIGDFFEKHTDNYWNITEDIDRKITMSVQLSNDDEYADGELFILNEKIKLKKGSIVCFPSNYPHRVATVTNGIRWSLIGWAWGPSWK